MAERPSPDIKLGVLLLAVLVAGGLLALAWWVPMLGCVLLAIGLAMAFWQWRNWVALSAWRIVPHVRPPELPRPWSTLAEQLYRATRRHRERERNLLRQLRRDRDSAASLPDALVVVDRNDMIEWFSPLASTYFGLTPSDYGKLLPALVRHRDLIALLEGCGGDRIAEVQIEPHERTLELRIASLDDRRRLLIARDTTQVQRLLTMRQSFVANVSHELRTPLTVITGYVEQMDSPDMDLATIRGLAKRLASPTVRMKNLVDDLLLLTRLESSSTPSNDELQTVGIAEMVRGMVAELRPIDRNEHVIEVDLDGNTAARGIESELYSAISNLLVNALRYSPAGSEVSVSWQRIGERARCAVKDNGVGIAPEHLARITERFYRVDLGRSRNLGGTGLGLAIVKHVLRRHGSELQIESTPGTGSTFWFELDAAHLRVRDHMSQSVKVVT